MKVIYEIAWAFTPPAVAVMLIYLMFIHNEFIKKQAPETIRKAIKNQIQQSLKSIDISISPKLDKINKNIQNVDTKILNTDAHIDTLQEAIFTLEETNRFLIKQNEKLTRKLTKTENILSKNKRKKVKK